MKMMVAPSIRPSVRCDDTASYTVRLERGSVDDGMMKGNIDTPAVPMMPAQATEMPNKPAGGSHRALKGKDLIGSNTDQHCI